MLQEIKTALFNRDFAKAFGREDYLKAYAARWSPTRALCYSAVLEGLKGELEDIVLDENVSKTAGIEGEDKPQEEGEVLAQHETERRKTLRMVAIGGCAAEHVAFSSFISQHPLVGNLTLLDSAPWTTATNLLQTAITSPPPISQYASEAKKAANKPFIQPSQLKMEFKETDVLDLDKDQLRSSIGEQKCLVSILFTLNELYTSGGIGKTTKLLKNLGEVLFDGSLLLVLDSPGSYSETALGKEKKRYPMQWLLDHTLLETKSEGYAWEKLESNDSVWFRLPEGLEYPMQLENMRYQMHLYRIKRAPQNEGK